ncbi:hypothetical protein SAMN04515674_106202 [Pseudarcicella hirudinis]|uniref:Uncharacterized protein n=1 Tax=Pseudarcicella hirudinis TaxID=1079859 RepID=A0A1I5TV75_9BACT|nr:osmoprotectant transporter permease [Pseudarcicella hirudinis]SFP86497.1 hypothetical protein SAMN04515674_106202 [Pseudarcicella hirudinis]
MTFFWILWGIDAILSLIFYYFFLIGLADGSVSSFNIGLWLAIIAITGGLLYGSLLLKKNNRLRLAQGLLLIFAIPGVLSGVFFLLLIIMNPNWH